MTEQVNILRETSVQYPPLKDCVRHVVEQHIASFQGKNISDLYDLIIGDMEQALIERVLEYTGGNESRAAKILGISRGTLRQRRREYGHYESK